MCVCFVFLLIFSNFQKIKIFWGMDALALLYFVEIRRISVCGYGSIDVHRKSVDMDMDMDGKFHIRGMPGHPVGGWGSGPLDPRPPPPL